MAVGVLHPGEMGAAVAQVLRQGGAEVLWCAAGRSAATAERASGLPAAPTLTDLTANASIILSICPPAYAEEVATAVAETGFSGLYVDANAINPQRASAIASRLDTARFVDGGIIGPPPDRGRRNRLYLSGPSDDIAAVSALFTGTAVETVDLGTEIGAASGMKMAYAGYNKATFALAAVAHALAAEYGVTDHLLTEAARTTTSALSATETLPTLVDRAWRWAPEMREVADTMRAKGLPPDFGEAAAAVFDRWTDDKGEDLPLSEFLGRLKG